MYRQKVEVIEIKYILNSMDQTIQIIVNYFAQLVLPILKMIYFSSDMFKNDEIC